MQLDWLSDLWHRGFSDGKFFWVSWHFWKAVGWLGNGIFFSRFFVQWYATEKKKQVVVPTAFWWLSLAGSLTLLCYAIHEQSSVFIGAYLFPWIPYMRNLIIHYRHKKAHTDCGGCGKKIPPLSNYCPNCGLKVD